MDNQIHSTEQELYVGGGSNFKQQFPYNPLKVESKIQDLELRIKNLTDPSTRGTYLDGNQIIAPPDIEESDELLQPVKFMSDETMVEEYYKQIDSLKKYLEVYPKQPFSDKYVIPPANISFEEEAVKEGVPADFVETFKVIANNVGDFVPFYGSVNSMKKNFDYSRALERVVKDQDSYMEILDDYPSLVMARLGAETERRSGRNYPLSTEFSFRQYEDDLKFVNEYLHDQQVLRGPKSFGGQWLTGMAYMTKWGLEFATMSGLISKYGTSGAQYLANSTMQKATQAGFNTLNIPIGSPEVILANLSRVGFSPTTLQKIGAFGIDVGSRVAMNFPAAIANAYERRTPDLYMTQDGRLAIAPTTESEAMSLLMGTLSHVIETGSEMSGEYLVKALGKMPFLNKVVTKLDNSFLNPEKLGAVGRWMTKASKTGLLGEYLEERAATLGHALVGDEDFGLGPNSTIPQRIFEGLKQDFKNIGTEIAVLGTPYVAGKLTMPGNAKLAQHKVIRDYVNSKITDVFAEETDKDGVTTLKNLTGQVKQDVYNMVKSELRTVLNDDKKAQEITDKLLPSSVVSVTVPFELDSEMNGVLDSMLLEKQDVDNVNTLKDKLLNRKNEFGKGIDFSIEGLEWISSNVAEKIHNRAKKAGATEKEVLASKQLREIELALGKYKKIEFNRRNIDSRIKQAETEVEESRRRIEELGKVETKEEGTETPTKPTSPSGQILLEQINLRILEKKLNGLTSKPEPYEFNPDWLKDLAYPNLLVQKLLLDFAQDVDKRTQLTLDKPEYSPSENILKFKQQFREMIEKFLDNIDLSKIPVAYQDAIRDIMLRFNLGKHERDILPENDLFEVSLFINQIYKNGIEKKKDITGDFNSKVRAVRLKLQKIAGTLKGNFDTNTNLIEFEDLALSETGIDNYEVKGEKKVSPDGFEYIDAKTITEKPYKPEVPEEDVQRKPIKSSFMREVTSLKEGVKKTFKDIYTWFDKKVSNQDEVEHSFQLFDGTKFGYLSNYMNQTLEFAGQKAYEVHEKIISDIAKILNTKGIDWTTNKRLSDGLSYSTESALFTYLNSFNPQNREALRNSGLTDKRINEIIANLTEGEKKAGDELLKYIQTFVYNLVDATHQRMFNSHLNKVADYFILTGFDWVTPDVAQSLDLHFDTDIKENRDRILARTKHEHGFKEFSLTLAIQRLSNTVASFTGYAETFKELNAVLRDGDTSHAIVSKIGAHRYDQIMDYLKDVVNPIHHSAIQETESFLQKFKGNVVNALIAGKLSSMLKAHVSALNAVGEVLNYFPGAYVREASLEYFANAHGISKEVYFASPMMRERHGNFEQTGKSLKKELSTILMKDRNFSEMVRREFGPWFGKLGKRHIPFKDFLSVKLGNLWAVADSNAANFGWWIAYRCVEGSKSVPKDGKLVPIDNPTDARVRAAAIWYADKVIAETQTTGIPRHRSAIGRNKGAIHQLYNLFLTQQMKNLNQFCMASTEAIQQFGAKDYMKAMNRIETYVTWQMILPALAMSLAGRGRPPEDWKEFFIDLASNQLGGVFILGRIASMWQWDTERALIPSGLAPLEELITMVKAKEASTKLKHGVKFGAEAFGIPGYGQAEKMFTGEGLKGKLIGGGKTKKENKKVKGIWR